MEERQYQTIIDHIDDNSRRLGAIEARFEKIEVRFDVAAASVLKLTNDIAEVRGALQERSRTSGLIALLVSAIVSGLITLFGTRVK